MAMARWRVFMMASLRSADQGGQGDSDENSGIATIAAENYST
jgi:hypothetical protein